MGSDARQLHIFFFPLMAPGHTIPAVDMAKLFARRGVRSSIITTPSNAPAIQASLLRAGESGHPVQTLLVEFPASEAGLPEGCDNLNSITSPDTAVDFVVSTAIMRRPFERLLREHRPDAVVTDMFYPWTADVAEELGVPRLVFHGTCFFSRCVQHALYKYAPHEDVSDDDRLVTVPGLPHRIQLWKSQIPNRRSLRPDMAELLMKVGESEDRSYGVVMNSCYEMEPDYADHYRKEMGRKAWHVGPVSLCNEDAVDRASRGGGAAAHDQASYLTWLGSKEPSSVIYVCFGSLCRFTAAQLREIAAGLEASGHPFMWVVRDAGLQGVDASQWLPEGFEERTKGTGKGVVIKGWAPQLLLLNHESVGGFVTHCGWNSSLEGIAAGLPMVTWPLFAEQFYNERLLVDVMQIGVSIGVKRFTMLVDDRPLVTAEEITRAVARLMGGEQEADDRRRRARELKEAARRAAEEGGSSYDDVGRLIQELLEKQAAAM